MGKVKRALREHSDELRVKLRDAATVIHNQDVEKALILRERNDQVARLTEALKQARAEVGIESRDARIGQLTTELAALREQATETGAEWNRLYTRVKMLSGELFEAVAEAGRWRASYVDCLAELERVGAKLVDAEAGQRALSAERDATVAEVADIEALEAKVARLCLERAGADAEIERLDGRVTGQVEVIAKLRAAIDERDALVNNQADVIVELRASLTDVTVERDAAQAEVADIEALEATIVELRAEVDSWRTSYAKLGIDYGRVETERDAARDAGRSAVDRAKFAEASIARHEAEGHGALEAEIERLTAERDAALAVSEPATATPAEVDDALETLRRQILARSRADVAVGGLTRIEVAE